MFEISVMDLCLKSQSIKQISAIENYFVENIVYNEGRVCPAVRKTMCAVPVRVC